MAGFLNRKLKNWTADQQTAEPLETLRICKYVYFAHWVKYKDLHGNEHSRFQSLKDLV